MPVVSPASVPKGTNPQPDGDAMTPRPPVSGEPSTEASVDYAVHLMENMLRSAAPYHKPFIEQHIANVRALAEARATQPSLDVERLVATIDKHALFYDDIGEAFCECGEWDGSNSWAEHLAALLTSKEEQP